MPRYPVSTTAQREAARDHTHRAYAERNELLLILARLWPSHLMDITGRLAPLTARRALCIHSPEGQLVYVLSEDEVAQFSDLPSEPSHWDRCTRVQRSERIARISETIKALPR